jgi:hypothetical protein
VHPENHTCVAIKQVFRISAHFLEDISIGCDVRAINLIPQHTQPMFERVPFFIADRTTEKKRKSHQLSVEMSSCLFFFYRCLLDMECSLSAM